MRDCWEQVRWRERERDLAISGNGQSGDVVPGGWYQTAFRLPSQNLSRDHKPAARRSKHVRKKERVAQFHPAYVCLSGMLELPSQREFFPSCMYRKWTLSWYCVVT
jgi:hypothetical protein